MTFEMALAEQTARAGGRMGRDAFLRISGHLAEERSPRSALAAVAAEIAGIVPYTHADICLHDAPGWVVSYEVGIQTRWSRTRTRVQFSPVRELLTGQSDLMLTANAMEDPRYVYPGSCCEPILNHQMRSRVNVPMRVMGRVIGTFNISHSTAGLYDMDTVQEVRDLANALAPYFHALHSAEKAQQAAKGREEVQAREEFLRRGALELTQAMETERQRVGMDLHDQTLADLTRLLRDLSGEGTPPDGATISARLTGCIADLRQIIDMAVPTLLEFFGFAHAVSVHLERAIGEADIALEVTDSTNGAPDRLEPTRRTALFRIAQEAINNAARHSGATLIAVYVDEDDTGRLCLTIRDNGAGLGAGQDRPPSGLAHMRTRAALIGAEFAIFEDGGTCVAVSLRQETP